MAMLNLLVAFNGSESSISALRHAAGLARAQGGHVTAILAHSTHDVIDRSSRWIPQEAQALLLQARQGITGAIKARFAELAKELSLGDALSFREKAGRIDAVLAEAARHFDLLVVGRHLDDDDEHVALHPDRIALMSGRPVIVVPEGYDSGSRHSHAALAWDGGRAAARALSDSLRLLEAEGLVSVLTVGKSSGWPVDDLLVHLARHGVAARHENYADSRSVSDAILEFCERNDPSLLVLGAYEHSKFREDFLGGVTTAVLKQARIPVLLSH